MVTYSDLFQFVIMLVAVITLVYSCTKKPLTRTSCERFLKYKTYTGLAVLLAVPSLNSYYHFYIDMSKIINFPQLQCFHQFLNSFYI